MRNSSRWLFSLCAAALVSIPVARASQAPRLGLHVAPCAIGKSHVKAECGTFGVYENRAAKRGRIIELYVIVVSATKQTHRAIAEIAGGPGESITQYADDVADGNFMKSTIPLRDTYDILFVDDRGVGKSNPFKCNFAPANDPAAYFREIYPERIVKDCKRTTAATHDRALYNTNASVDDLNDVRAALGYPRIVIAGGSYGTLFSLVYLRRHPETVESVVLDSVSAPHFQVLPGSPDGAERALDDLAAKCRRTAPCARTFPKFRSHFEAVVQRLKRGPIDVPVKNLATKKTVTVPLSEQVFVDQVRHVLYDSLGSSYLPFTIERAYVGDYAPLGRMVNLVSVLMAGSLDEAANLSYSCSDWLPFVDNAALRKAAAHSFAGDIRVQAQRHACAIWNVPPMPAAFDEPVRSDAPILIIASEDDPATPPQYGEAALRYLPNGREALVKGAGHSTETPCTDDLIVRFVRARSARDIDVTRCSGSFTVPPFATSMKGFPEL